MRNGSRKSLVSVIAGSYIQQEEKHFRNVCWYRMLLGQWSCSACKEISHCLGSQKIACTETDHQSPSSTSSFLLIYPQFISHIFYNIISLTTRFHLPDFVITRRCHNRNLVCGLHISYPCHPFWSVFLKILIEEFSCEDDCAFFSVSFLVFVYCPFVCLLYYHSQFHFLVRQML